MNAALDTRRNTPASGALDGLSREARDTLFMLALIGWTLAPHLWRISPWVAALCAALLLWRTVLALLQAPLPGRLVLTAVLALAVTLTFWREHTLLGKDAGVTLLCVLMSLKTLELRARRDALVVFFLGFFLVLTQFLYSQSLLTALATLVSTWGWLTALTLAHMPAGRPPLALAARLAARAALIGTPLMVLLFVLFPRIAPLWALPGDAASTGLSDRLRLGAVAELALDDSVALRVKLADPQKWLARLPPSARYFRGPVLSWYDGNEWRVTAPPRRVFDAPRLAASTVPAQLEGQALDYEITLEPLRVPWLPLLELTPETPIGSPAIDALRARTDARGHWQLAAPLAERTRARARAWPAAVLQARTLPRDDLNENLLLPLGKHPRTVAWAEQWRQDAGLRQADATAVVQALLAHIRANNYRYTLEPGSTAGDAVDDFWLNSRAGFCEHYAAASAIVLRALSIPARIVTGYQGGDAELSDGYLVVRQSHAHAWIEYWQAGRGWVRADPTGAVAPERIDRSVALRPAPGLVASAIENVTPGLREALRRWAELVDNRWNQWVLGFGRTQQYQWLNEWGFETPEPALLARLLGGVLAALALLGALWAWHDGRRRTPWQRLQMMVRRELGHLDITAAPHDSPALLAQRVAARYGRAGSRLAASLLALSALRYAPGAAATLPPLAAARWRRKFRRHARDLRQTYARRAHHAPPETENLHPPWG